MTSYLQALLSWLTSTCRFYGSSPSSDVNKNDNDADIAQQPSSSNTQTSANKTAAGKRAERHMRRSQNASTSSTSSTMSTSSAASSFAPVILVPGVVNASLMLLPTDPCETSRRRAHSSAKKTKAKATELQRLSRASIDSLDSETSAGSSTTPVSQEPAHGTMSRRSPYAISEEHETAPVLRLR
ncbi:uncharacterized protein FOMMEDRAFT_143794 [Fomitiporia mediterranea MF3/22]|uniref:uncharacterized protein n=1 Tax=Fomitiporia mediterranea (strain MF3/22) TaxID=694068 RepID=UPI0004409B98|nr:uncharacterized protein FOMMEDRAFT_143794 [Fomitiporia mediterranea MF3/22]EJD07351.1 hypothetical protein FOMMEDRAFT_143794 [Fomitiporia mediterranea MF3/22]